MTIGELREALDKFPEDATLRVGISIPDLYINTVANGAITGNHVDPAQCTEVRFVATVPERTPPMFRQQLVPGNDDADTDEQGAV